MDRVEGQECRSYFVTDDRCIMMKAVLKRDEAQVLAVPAYKIR